MPSFLFCTDLYIFDYIIRKHFAPKFKIDKNDYDKSCSKKISDQEFVKKLACKQWNVQEIKEISKKYFNKSCSEKYCSSKSEKIKKFVKSKMNFFNAQPAIFWTDSECARRDDSKNVSYMPKIYILPILVFLYIMSPCLFFSTSSILKLESRAIARWKALDLGITNLR